MLPQLVAHLRSCSLATFAETVNAASTGYAAPAVWTRSLGVGAERVCEVADLLWPFACNVAILTHNDIVRDAVGFLAAVYPTRSPSERAAFEEEVLRAGVSMDEAEKRWWRCPLSRFLSLVNVDAVATDPMRVLRDELVAADELAGNPPTRSMSVRWGSSRGVGRTLLAAEGVDVEEGVDAQMLSLSDALYDKLGLRPRIAAARPSPNSGRKYWRR